FQAEDGIRDFHVTGVQTCALPIFRRRDSRPNARFIVLDPNGEYAEAFKDLDDVRLFQVDVGPNNGESRPLKVPAWLWNGEEWAEIGRASCRESKEISVVRAVSKNK